MRETKEDRVCGRGRNNGEQIKGGTRGDGVLCGRARGRLVRVPSGCGLRVGWRRDGEEEIKLGWRESEKKSESRD